MKTLKLRTRLTVLILIIAAPIFAAVTIFVSAQAWMLLEKSAMKDLQETTDALGASVTSWLGSYAVLLKHLTALSDIISMDPEQQEPVLRGTASADPNLFLVQTVGLDGVNIARSDGTNLRDYSDRQWYLGSVAGNALTTQVLISRTTGNPALNMAMPIKNAEGEIIGVISIVSELDEVTKAVHASAVGRTGFAYVVDNFGHVVAHPDPAFSDELRDLSNYPPVVFMQTNPSGALNFTDEQGIRWTANVTRLENGWGVIVQQQENELLGPLRYFQFVSFTFATTGILLLLLTSGWIIRRALNPIETLTKTALAITNGDFDRIAPVESRDEIGTLAHAFNSMTVQMRELILSLEQRVNQLNETEVALKASLLRQAAILDNIPDLAWLKDEESRFIAVNEPFGRACGIPPVKITGKTDLDIWPEALAQEYRKDDLEVMRSGVRKHIEEPLVDSDGQTSFLETIKTPIFDGNGRVIGTAGIARDITERKRAENALKQSETRYRAIVEETTDLICRFLPDTTLTFVNEAYCRYFDKSREELIGMRFLNLIPNDDHEGVLTHINSIIRNKHSVTYSHEVFTPAGEICWQQWTDSAILNEHGEVDELQSVGRDITEQIQAEKAIQESERRFREVLQGVNLAGVMLDKSGRISFINDFLLQLTGWSREEAIGENWFDNFLPLAIRDYIKTTYTQLIDNAHIPPRYENEIVGRDGQLHLLRWNNMMLFDVNGQVIGTASIGDDITERKRIEAEREKLIAELEAKNSELERFTYTVSHDLKSPLVTIKGFLGFLKQDVASGNLERFEIDLERIGSAAKKMEQLLKDLLELSRIGRVLNPMTRIPFGTLVEDALNLVQGQIAMRGIRVLVQQSLPVVYGDRQRLVEVLQNLIDNATKYIGNQTEPLIEIGMRSMENDQSTFFVRDNGIGIDPQHHERVFGLFNKLDIDSEGTGVGLALVKRIVEFHGGKIWVESKGRNMGTCICFTLQLPPDSTPEGA